MHASIDLTSQCAEITQLPPRVTLLLDTEQERDALLGTGSPPERGGNAGNEWTRPVPRRSSCLASPAPR